MKKEGFSDAQISLLTQISEDEVRSIRKKANIISTYKTVDTCAAEFIAQTPYCYSTYETENEITPLKAKKISFNDFIDHLCYRYFRCNICVYCDGVTFWRG